MLIVQNTRSRFGSLGKLVLGAQFQDTDKMPRGCSVHSQQASLAMFRDVKFDCGTEATPFTRTEDLNFRTSS